MSYLQNQNQKNIHKMGVEKIIFKIRDDEKANDTWLKSCMQTGDMQRWAQGRMIGLRSLKD